VAVLLLGEPEGQKADDLEYAQNLLLNDIIDQMTPSSCPSSCPLPSSFPSPLSSSLAPPPPLSLEGGEPQTKKQKMVDEDLEEMSKEVKQLVSPFQSFLSTQNPNSEQFLFSMLNLSGFEGDDLEIPSFY